MTDDIRRRVLTVTDEAGTVVLAQEASRQLQPALADCSPRGRSLGRPSTLCR